MEKKFQHEHHRRQDKVRKPDYREELWLSDASPHSWSGDNRGRIATKTSVVLSDHLAVWYYEYQGRFFHRDLSPEEFGEMNGLSLEVARKHHEELKVIFAADVVELRKLVPHTELGFQTSKFTISDSGELSLAADIQATRVSRRPFRPSTCSVTKNPTVVKNLRQIADLLLMPKYYRETAVFHNFIPIGLGSRRVLAMVKKFRELMFETEGQISGQDRIKIEIRQHINRLVKCWVNLEAEFGCVIAKPGGAGQELVATVMKVDSLIQR